MNNDNQSNTNSRGLHFSHSFNIGTTLQNVFRNINHAFAGNHDSGSGQQRDEQSRDYADNVPPPESVGGAHGTRPTDVAQSSPSSTLPNPSVSSVSTPTDNDMPPQSQPDSQRDDDEISMPELRSVGDSSDSSDAGIATLSPMPPHQDSQPVESDRDNVRMGDEDGPPPLEPITGTRRARVDDDGDDARDRRHPSERVGAPPPLDNAAPQGANPQQLPRPPPGLLGALFGLGPLGANFPGGEAPPEHVQTGEDATDPSPTGNNAAPGRAPRGVPILTAGFTLTIPLFGPPPGNRTGPPAGGQGGPQGVPQGLFGMDAAAREELFASFAAFFQELQALDEAREDPERAKKLLAGLEVVPLGLVKRLERVGGAPGGHIGDANTEESLSGCAICWDKLLDGESDNFSSHQFPGDGEVPQPSSSGTPVAEGQHETHTESNAMDVDASSDSPSHSETSVSSPTPPEAPKIITLPCAHVFHASCLLPWFTRAKQATCPTCRFNIDPENLTYTPPPRRTFNRAAPAQPDNTGPNPAPAGAQVAPEVSPATGNHAADAAAPPVDPVAATAGDRPAAVPPGPIPPPPTGQAGGMPGGPGFNPFAAMPGIPVLHFPAIQIPLRPTGAQTPGGGNQGIDVVTIGLDMFVGGLPPPEERDGNPRDNVDGGDGAGDGGADTGAAGANGGANPNVLAQDLQSLMERIFQTTQNILPQVINAQGPVPAPAPAADALPVDGAQQPQSGPAPEAARPQPVPPSADGAQPQPQARPTPEAVGPQPVPPPAGGPRAVPIFPFHPMMFRPTRPMPPRRERKTWTLPPAPGPSLRQHVEQREREQGLRCSDTSCGVGPSDDDPYPEPSASSTKQVFIHPLPDANHENDVHAVVCAHAFHPACLVSAERVAGWGGEDMAEPLVEVSCPVCRAVGCVTREEWEMGVSAL